MLVLLTEDDEDYAEIIAETLRRESHDVVIAGTVNGALRFTRQGFPDLAVLDVMLPDGSGIDVSRALREARPDLPIVFLSSLDRAGDVVAALDAGGDDYITKPFHPHELLARIRAVARRATTDQGEPQRPADGIAGDGVEFDDHAHVAYLDASDLKCTRLEFDILRELAAVPGQVLSHAYLNERIWGYTNMKDGTLLKGHISSIRRKLRKAGDRNETIRTVHGVGYALATR